MAGRAAQADVSDRPRLDKWLWHARLFKTRTLAARQVSDGRVRVNGVRVQKPAQSVAPGDVLTVALARAVRVLRIERIGSRRGPAGEAQTLYTDLDPPQDSGPANPRYEGKGRPEKRDRRAIDLSRRQSRE